MPDRTMGLDSTRLGTVTPPAPAITSRDHPMSTFERMLTVLRARLGNQGRDLAALTRPGEPQRRGFGTDGPADDPLPSRQAVQCPCGL